MGHETFSNQDKDKLLNNCVEKLATVAGVSVEEARRQLSRFIQTTSPEDFAAMLGLDRETVFQQFGYGSFADLMRALQDHLSDAEPVGFKK